MTETTNQIGFPLELPRGDFAACAGAILKILDDDSLAARMGASARARVEERFSLERTVDRYFALYRRMTGRWAIR